MLIGGKPMLARCVEGMSAVCRRIIVVGGFELDRIRTIVQGFESVECVENPDYEKGMFTSVRVGLAMSRGERCFVLPADIPLVPEVVYRKLLAVDADIVVPTFKGKNGHPLVLSAGIIPRILREPDESSLRNIIRTIGFDTIEVEAEEILLDIDTPEDYQRILQRSP